MYIFVYVPTTGRTASATARNRVGPLPAHSPIVGGGIRARAGPLQRLGASSSCSTPEGRAGAKEQEQSFPVALFFRRPCVQQWVLAVPLSPIVLLSLFIFLLRLLLQLCTSFY